MFDSLINKITVLYKLHHNTNNHRTVNYGNNKNNKLQYLINDERDIYYMNKI